MTQKAQHSPGPFEVFEAHSMRELRWCFRSVATKRWVADVNFSGMQDPGEDALTLDRAAKEAKATAALFTAAPDLLQALNALVEKAEELGCVGDYWNDARAAIRKATSNVQTIPKHD